MGYLLKAEIFKLFKKKLIYIAIPLILLPLIISYDFISKTDVIQLHGSYGFFEYLNGMFGSIILGTGVVILFLSLLITSFISDEIKSGLILFQITSFKKREHLFWTKMLLSLSIGLIFIFLTLCSIAIGYFLFIKNSHLAQSTDNYNDIYSLFFAIIYFLCAILIISSLAFLGGQKSLVFGSFILFIMVINLSDSKLLSPYILGSPIFSSIERSQQALLHLEITHGCFLLLITTLILLLSKRHFLKRDF